MELSATWSEYASELHHQPTFNDETALELPVLPPLHAASSFRLRLRYCRLLQYLSEAYDRLFVVQLVYPVLSRADRRPPTGNQKALIMSGAAVRYDGDDYRHTELREENTKLTDGLLGRIGSRGGVPHPPVAGYHEGQAQGCRDGPQLAEAQE